MARMDMPKYDATQVSNPGPGTITMLADSSIGSWVSLDSNGVITPFLMSVTPTGSGPKPTVNSHGQVTALSALDASDIPTLTASKVSDFNTQVRISRLDQMAVPTADVSANGYKVTSLATGTASGDAVNYAQLQTKATAVSPTGGAGTYPKVTINSQGIVTAGAALIASDLPALTHTAISDFDTRVRTSRLDQMATATANISMGGCNISSLANAINPTDAVNLSQINGKMTNPFTTLGQMIYCSVDGSPGTVGLVGPNTAVRKKFSTMAGTGSAGAIPQWGTILLGDLRDILLTDTSVVPSAIYVSPSDAPASYFDGIVMLVKVANTNVGATTIQINPLSTVNVLMPDGGAMAAGSLVIGGVYMFVSQGGAFYAIGLQTLADLGGVPTSRTVAGHALTANVTISASDVGAASSATTVNGHVLTSNVTVSASDVGLGTTSTPQVARLGLGGPATVTSLLNLTGLPTSAAGLVTGDLWSDSGTIKVV